MAYSSIISKNCKCGCNRRPTLGYQGYNSQCRPDLVAAKIKRQNSKQQLAYQSLGKKERRNVKRSVASSIRSLADKQNQPDKIKEAELELFFMLAATEIAKDPHCENCGAYIPNKKMNSKGEWVETKMYYRAATAHVLAKRENYGFPSIASNPINWLKLGAGCGCHNRYDRSWEDAAQMKVWPLAVEKFKLLYPLIDAKEKKNIPEILMQEINV